MATTPAASSRSSRVPVSEPGPSSKVNATHLSLVQSTAAAGGGATAGVAGGTGAGVTGVAGATGVGAAEVGTDTAYGRPDRTASATRRPRSDNNGSAVAWGTVTVRFPAENGATVP
ncbi:MAG: hypothetical protein BWY91_03175 [bacterium ADurb.BinA028]|nr:MAG: hypothetical protein BWY91_03175 [bacterium ADurb.BinA028]